MCYNLIIQVCGSVCAYSSASPGSNPKDHIYAFSIWLAEIFEIGL